MSYVRWSSPLKLTGPCPACRRQPRYAEDEHENWHQTHSHQMWWARGPWFWRLIDRLSWIGSGGRISGGGLRGKIHWWAAFHQRGFCRTCTSPWYIYGDVNGKLAIWARGRPEGEPLYYATDEDCREMLEAEDYSRIPGFEEHGDCGVVASSIREYLSEDWEEQA